MAGRKKQQNLLLRLRLRFRRSSLLTKLLIGLVLVASVVVLVAQQTQVRANRARLAELTDQAAALQQANQELQAEIEDLDSDESIKKIARDKLGLVGSGEVIFSDIGE